MTVETTGDDEDLCEMIRVVCAHGDAFTGGVASDAAQGWLDADFTPGDAEEWMDAGWWDCDRAGTARDLGLTPQQTVDRAESLTDAVEHGEPRYTDGCPIYSICNGDTSVDVLLAEVA